MVGSTSQQCPRTMRGIVGLILGSVAVAVFCYGLILFITLIGVTING